MDPEEFFRDVFGYRIADFELSGRSALTERNVTDKIKSMYNVYDKLRKSRVRGGPAFEQQLEGFRNSLAEVMWVGNLSKGPPTVAEKRKAEHLACVEPTKRRRVQHKQESGKSGLPATFPCSIRLCTRFKLEPIELISGMRDTAEVERSVNQMNLICNDSRTRTLIINLSSLMFININGPEVLDLNVTSYAKLWLVNHATADRKQGQKREGKRGLVYTGKLVMYGNENRKPLIQNRCLVV
ncbi:E3 SUMO-protein ligase KIAA1586 [Frankliniella fusca]|uniref:E3 SUMO-protein ligase KIAA1586 n=1 Tax=Frankliniella fusca TaxID=407009 RepID=A0AAE1LHT6_9NEOP|nr:E3 SUMO-protein ligase KIAA1586 [Frankliniella fusca]